MRNIIIGLTILVIGTSCIFEMQAPYSKIAPGSWRGVIQLERKINPINKKAKPSYIEQTAFEEIAAGEVPFIFNVAYDKNDDLRWTIINKDSTLVAAIHYAFDKSTAYDTMRITFNDSSYIQALTQDGIIEGDWYHKNGGPLHFIAKQGKNIRFTNLKKEPIHPINDKWNLVTIDDTYSSQKLTNIPLEIFQEGNYAYAHLTYNNQKIILEGTVQANKFYLSRFDGNHAYSIEGKIISAKNITGTLKIDKIINILWNAQK